MRQTFIAPYAGTGATQLINIGFNPIYVEIVNRMGHQVATWSKNYDPTGTRICCPGLTRIIDDPGIGVGSTPANVSNVAFRYEIAGIPYVKAATPVGTALSASTIPDGLWGAASLEIVAAGTITIILATGNATGYANAELAIAGIPVVAGATLCRVGMVAAKNVGATFVMGTTSLAATTATVAFFTGGVGITGVTGSRLSNGIIPYGDVIGDTYMGVELAANEIINKLGETYWIKAYRS